jgi:hypothetical protein
MSLQKPNGHTALSTWHYSVTIPTTSSLHQYNSSDSKDIIKQGSYEAYHYHEWSRSSLKACYVVCRCGSTHHPLFRSQDRSGPEPRQSHRKAVLSRKTWIRGTIHGLYPRSRVLAGNPHNSHIYPCPCRARDRDMPRHAIRVLVLNHPENRPAGSSPIRKLRAPEDSMQARNNFEW